MDGGYISGNEAAVDSELQPLPANMANFSDIYAPYWRAEAPLGFETLSFGAWRFLDGWPFRFFKCFGIYSGFADYERSSFVRKYGYVVEIRRIFAAHLLYYAYFYYDYLHIPMVQIVARTISK